MNVSHLVTVDRFLSQLASSNLKSTEQEYPLYLIFCTVYRPSGWLSGCFSKCLSRYWGRYSGRYSLRNTRKSRLSGIYIRLFLLDGNQVNLMLIQYMGFFNICRCVTIIRRGECAFNPTQKKLSTMHLDDCAHQCHCPEEFPQTDCVQSPRLWSSVDPSI